MVVIRKITDSDLIFHANGRITVRNHPMGVKGLLVLKRDTCPFCVRALEASEKLASRYSSIHPLYVVDIQDPACAISVRTWNPNGVPYFVRVNKLGKVDTQDYNVDWSNEQAFIQGLRRES